MNALGIGVIPGEADTQQLIKASGRLHAQMGFKRPLNSTDNCPHVSLIHMCELELRVVDQVEQTFANFVGGRGSSYTLELRPDKISFVPVGWLFLDIVRTSRLVDLHSSVFSKFNRFLEPPTIEKDISLYSLEERKSFLAYGYRYIGPAFRPHVTLGRLSDSSSNDLSRPAIENVGYEVLADIGQSMLAAELILFDIGTDGACQNIRCRYPLDVSNGARNP